MEAKIIRKMAR